MAWTPTKITERSTDMANKVRVIVEITDGVKTESIMLKFQSDPKDAVILAEAQKVCTIKSIPVPIVETVDDLKIIIAEKDILLAEKEAIIIEKDIIIAEKDALIAPIIKVIK